MPHMQRLTWSGIALHGGYLRDIRRRTAVSGCRTGFAERLFDMTSLGMRVIVAPADVAPVSIVHPALFQPKADAGAVAAARAAEAEEATKKADEAGTSSSSKSHEKRHKRWSRCGLRRT